MGVPKRGDYLTPNQLPRHNDQSALGSENVWSEYGYYSLSNSCGQDDLSWLVGDSRVSG